MGDRKEKETPRHDSSEREEKTMGRDRTKMEQFLLSK
jgi:hypothetical protein